MLIDVIVFSWGDMSKCLLTIDGAPRTDQSNNSYTSLAWWIYFSEHQWPQNSCIIETSYPCTVTSPGMELCFSKTSLWHLWVHMQLGRITHSWKGRASQLTEMALAVTLREQHFITITHTEKTVGLSWLSRWTPATNTDNLIQFPEPTLISCPLIFTYIHTQTKFSN